MREDTPALRQRIRNLSKLKTIVMEISRIRDLDALCRFVAEEVARLLDAEFVRVRLNDQVVAGPDAEAGLAELTAPILLHGRLIGALEASGRTVGSFDSDDEDLLQTVAAHLATSIENCRLVQASERRLDELAALVEISQVISTSLDNHTLFENIAHKLVEITGVNEFIISLWDRSTDQLVTLLNHASDAKHKLDEAGRRYSLSDYPLTREALDTHAIKIVHVHDPDADLAEKRFLEACGRSTAIIIPLIVRNKSTGIMEILFDNGHGNPEYPIHFYQSIASLIAAAIDNSQLYETTRLHARELEKRVVDRTLELERLYKQQAALADSEREQRKLVETLREAVAIVAAKLDLDQAISEILTQLARVVPHDSASVQLLKDSELVIVGGGGWNAFNDPTGMRFPVPGPNPNTIVIETRAPLILSQEQLRKFESFQHKKYRTICSWLGVPLISQGSVIGMLTLDSSAPSFFNQQHTNLVVAFADQVAVAIEQAILFDRTRAALSERDALRSIVAEITDELDLSRLLNSVLVRACELLDAGSAELALYREETQTAEIVAAHNMGGNYIGTHLALGSGAIGYTALVRESLIIADYHNWVHALPTHQEQPWLAVMTTPLTYQQRLIGVIAMADKRPERQFGRSDLELLDMFAHQVAIAIENAQLFQKVQLLATTDELTGLLNRRELFRLGEELRRQAVAKERPLTAAMLDLDLFKIINDTYGHSVGDQVLKGLAEICNQRIRSTDLLGRYGGEEFTLLLPDTSFEDGCEIAERLRRAIEEEAIQTDRGVVRITVSFGVAVLSPRHTNLATLLDEADLAMYQAKHRGRNQVVGICNP